MSRFNSKDVPTVGPRSYVESTGEREATFGGASGYLRGAKSELFLLASSFMGGDDNFYEKSDGRYDRLVSLVEDQSVYSDIEWLYGFIGWLRNDANMRTVAMVVAVEVVISRLAYDLTEPVEIPVRGLGNYRAPVSNRNLVDVSMSRADEPAETMAYWKAKHGGLMPQPIKAGIGDAAVRLYNEFSFIKYGSSVSSRVTMRDVIRMVHPKPKDDKQSALFEYIVGKRELTNSDSLPDSLNVLFNRQEFQGLSVETRKSIVSESAFAHIGFTTLLKQAGITWEMLSEWSPEGMTGRVWDAIIPNMGVMALIRNLRNFDEAGITDASAWYVNDLIASEETVRKSRLLPFRWYNAYRSVESVRWSESLDTALNYSLSNIPRLSGHTLVLVDMSASMFGAKMSDKSNVLYADAAALFGSALKRVNQEGVELYQFGANFDAMSRMYTNHRGLRYGTDPNERWVGATKKIDISRGGSILLGMNKFHDMGGTAIHQAIAETIRPYHNRVVLLTDEQGWRSKSTDTLPVPANVPLYVWNLGGYRAGISPNGSHNRHTFSGLSDQAFTMIPILESGKNAQWPWINREGVVGETQQNSQTMEKVRR